VFHENQWKHIVLSFIQDNSGQHFFLDGHNNPGFSGGPIVFKEPNKNDFKAASVISGYRYTNELIFAGEIQVPFAYRYNTGIIISCGIKHAVDLIEGNPKGLPINA